MMALFKTLKKNQYVENMDTISRVNLSLIETLTALQKEFETLEAENARLRDDIKRYKNMS